MDKCSQLGFWDWATHNDNLSLCVLLVCAMVIGVALIRRRPDSDSE